MPSTSIEEKNRPLSETHPCEKVDDEEEKLWNVDAALGARGAHRGGRSRRGRVRGGRPTERGEEEEVIIVKPNREWFTPHWSRTSRKGKSRTALTFLSRHSRSRLGWRSKSVASSPSSLIYRNGIVSCLFTKCKSPKLNSAKLASFSPKSRLHYICHKGDYRPEL